MGHNNNKYNYKVSNTNGPKQEQNKQQEHKEEMTRVPVQEPVIIQASIDKDLGFNKHESEIKQIIKNGLTSSDDIAKTIDPISAKKIRDAITEADTLELINNKKEMSKENLPIKKNIGKQLLGFWYVPVLLVTFIITIILLYPTFQKAKQYQSYSTEIQVMEELNKNTMQLSGMYLQLDQQQLKLQEIQTQISGTLQTIDGLDKTRNELQSKIKAMYGLDEKKE